MLATLLFLVAGCDGGSGSGDEDTATDDTMTTDTVIDEDTDDGGGDVPDDDPLDVDDGDAADADDEDGTTAPGCGDGVREGEEVCDDGNTQNEPCDGTDPAACLADCSLRTALCGDGATDPGEACDDGNLDEDDGCTTSCTVNDRGIGTPCACVEGCFTFMYNVGTIEGCDALLDLEDDSRVMGCIVSGRDDSYGFAFHAPGGYCTLFAMSCEGPGCEMIPDIGDIDAITCPEGSLPRTDVADVMGMTMTLTYCYDTCDTNADCRWNAVEDAGSPWAGDCGRYECLPVADDGSDVCMDAQNLD